ncbi:MAG: 2,3,4,5-tetrahydropyridine-2,6-dicarboxylate N-acetyltransferase [Anaerolineales bacterium]|nr:2,3,4,5-tetrahydropyridine-2,6-dicarboxylate N-acetyltransferase [Anaerolineales bacterium]
MFKIFNTLFHMFLKSYSNQTRLWYARRLGVHVGEDCRLYSVRFGSEPYLISIGNHVTITREVTLLTHDGGVWVWRHQDPTIDYIRPIVIEDNVFIGVQAIILPGVVIGRDSIVGAGAIVTKSVPPGSVVVGAPARIVSTTDAYMQKLKQGISTKGMSPQDKRETLLRTWGSTPEEWKTKLAELSAGTLDA